MDSRIKKIIEYAIMVPSGDNCHPWRFAVKNKQLDLYNLPEKDNRAW